MYEDSNERINDTPANEGIGAESPNTENTSPAPVAPPSAPAEQDACTAEEARLAQIAEAARRSEAARMAEKARLAEEAQQAAAAAQNIRSGEYSGAGVGQTYYSGAPQRPEAQAPYTQQSYAQAGSYYSAPQPPKAPKKEAKTKARPSFVFTAFLCVFCILLGACSGFGGALAYNYFFADGTASTTGGVNGEVTINQSTITPSDEIKEGSLTSVIESISKTVVEIRTEQVSYGSFFGNYVSEGAGSGVIISADGYIITNNHVVEGADTLTVRTKSGDEYEATLVGTDAQTDVAVIKVEATELPAATVGTSSDLLVGQRAIAIGNPLGELGGTVTIGYISALDREVNVDNVEMTLLQTDAAINPGNSGGGLFDESGRLIGIVNAKSSGSDIEGLGFAIPIDTAMDIATDLIEIGHVSGRPALGITIADVTSSNYSQFRGTELDKYIDTYGVYVTEDERGNFEFGDRIVAIDDVTVSGSSDLAEALTKLEIGDTVTVTVSRGRKLIEIEVELVELNG